MSADERSDNAVRIPRALRSIEAVALAGPLHPVLSLVSTYLLLRAPQASGILLSTPTMSAFLFGVVPETNGVALWQASGLTLATVAGTRLDD